MRQTRLNSKEKKKIVEMLNDNYGFEGNFDDFHLFKNSRDRISIIKIESFEKLNENMRIDSVGNYFGEMMNEKEFRLSIEGSQMIGPQCTKNILKINKDEVNLWIRGYDLDIESEEDSMKIVKYDKDYIACGKLKNKKLLNYVPKSRKINCKITDDSCSAKVV